MYFSRRLPHVVTKRDLVLLLWTGRGGLWRLFRLLLRSLVCHRGRMLDVDPF